jgi:hypothetical protein
VNVLTEPADPAPPPPEALPAQLNPTAHVRALSAEAAATQLAQVAAPKPTPPQGTPPVAATTSAPIAPAAPRPSWTPYAAAALALAVVLFASR